MEFKLNKKESLTLIEIAQDAIDRGMIASHYEIDTIEKIINTVTNEFGDISNDDIQITIQVNEK